MSWTSCFSRVFRNNVIKKSNSANIGTTSAARSKIWEPDYLILAKTKTPEYDLINFQIKSYDYVVLEQFQRLIHNLSKKMNITVTKSWASPQQDFNVHHYKPNSTDVEYKYDLKMHERNIQIVDVKSHIMPLFIEVVLTSCPPGVNINVHEHLPEMEDILYVPNTNIIELEQELETLDTKGTKK